MPHLRIASAREDSAVTPVVGLTSPLRSKPSMNYLDFWIANLRQRNSVRLTQGLTVVGHREKHFGPRSEFARVVMTIGPAEELDVVDNVPYRKELEALGVAWPQSVVFRVAGRCDVR